MIYNSISCQAIVGSGCFCRSIKQGWLPLALGVGLMGVRMRWAEQLLQNEIILDCIGYGSIALILIAIVIFVMDWQRFKSATNTHIKVLAIYYKELREYKGEDGIVIYEYSPGEAISRSGLSTIGGGGIKFLIMKLDIINLDAHENRLISCEARITRPKNLKTRVVQLRDAYVNDRDLGFYFAFPDDDRISFYLPQILKPKKTYTEFLCLELEDDFKLNGQGEIEIRIKDRLGKESKTKFKFGMKERNAFMVD